MNVEAVSQRSGVFDITVNSRAGSKLDQVIDMCGNQLTSLDSTYDNVSRGDQLTSLDARIANLKRSS
jgi:hypothetical protein